MSVVAPSSPSPSAENSTVREQGKLGRPQGSRRPIGRPLFLTLARNDTAPFLQVSPGLLSDTSSNCSTPASLIPNSPFTPGLELTRDHSPTSASNYPNRRIPRPFRPPLLIRDEPVGFPSCNDQSSSSEGEGDEDDDEAQYITLPPSSEYHVPFSAKPTFTLTPLLASPDFSCISQSPHMLPSPASSQSQQYHQPLPRVVVENSDQPLLSSPQRTGVTILDMHWQSALDESRLNGNSLDVPEDVDAFSPVSSKLGKGEMAWRWPLLHSGQQGR